MKHKTLAVLCAVVLTAGMMTGCGQKTEDTKTESGSEKTVSDEMAEKAGFSDGTGEEASDKKDASDAKALPLIPFFDQLWLNTIKGLIILIVVVMNVVLQRVADKNALKGREM